jgi:hypothetical protein
MMTLCLLLSGLFFLGDGGTAATAPAQPSAVRIDVEGAFFHETREMSFLDNSLTVYRTAITSYDTKGIRSCELLQHSIADLNQKGVLDDQLQTTRFLVNDALVTTVTITFDAKSGKGHTVRLSSREPPSQAGAVRAITAAFSGCESDASGR